MPILPLMDALILLGWSSLLVGFLLKAVYITTHYRPTLFGFSPIDFVLMAVVAMIFALTLAARAWVKAMEPDLLARRRRARALDRLGYEEYPEPEEFAEPDAARAELQRRSAAGR
jgi:hypothetical protein